MKKIFVFAAAAVCALALFTGCGKKETAKDVSVDVAKLCQDLKGTVQTELGDVNSDLIASTFFVDMEKIDESAAALSSGANACEVVVLKTKEASYTSECEELFKNRVSRQSELFADYDAPSVTKLDNAIIKTAGNYIVYCVTDDNDAAEKIISEAGF